MLTGDRRQTWSILLLLAWLNTSLNWTQHGFREKRSCEMQLILLIDELAKKLQIGTH